MYIVGMFSSLVFRHKEQNVQYLDGNARDTSLSALVLIHPLYVEAAYSAGQIENITSHV